jgi:hypothetical protein
MNRNIFILFFIFFLAFLVYAKEVPASNSGISNASPGDYIIKSNGERHILNQGDIEYARKQLGLTNTPSKQTQTYSTSNNTSSYSSSNSNGKVILIIVVLIIIHIILTICVYKIKGGAWAVAYFILAPIILLVLIANSRIANTDPMTGRDLRSGGACGRAYNCSGGGGTCGRAYNCAGR